MGSLEYVRDRLPRGAARCAPPPAFGGPGDASQAREQTRSLVQRNSAAAMQVSIVAVGCGGSGLLQPASCRAAHGAIAG